MCAGQRRSPALASPLPGTLPPCTHTAFCPVAGSGRGETTTPPTSPTVCWPLLSAQLPPSSLQLITNVLEAAAEEEGQPPPPRLSYSLPTRICPPTCTHLPSSLQLMTNVLAAEEEEGGVDMVMFGGDQVCNRQEGEERRGGEGKEGRREGHTGRKEDGRAGGTLWRCHMLAAASIPS